MAPSVASLLRSSCCGRGWAWEGVGTNVTRPSSRGLSDSATIIVSTERIIDGVVGEGDWGRDSICADFFFILSRAVNSRGLAAFRDGFRKGLGLNFFFLQLRSIGRKRGKGFGEWRAWFLILKLYGFNFSEWCKGREGNCKIYISLFLDIFLWM